MGWELSFCFVPWLLLGRLPDVRLQYVSLLRCQWIRLSVRVLGWMSRRNEPQPANSAENMLGQRSSSRMPHRHAQ